MSTKLTILAELRKVADEQAKSLAPLSDDLVLLDSGLDSLCFAVLVGRLPELRDRSVLIATGDQLTTALALIELDGVARRLILCPPDVAPEHLPSVIADAGVDALVSATVDQSRVTGVALAVTCGPALTPRAEDRVAPRQTEWVMFTSGTTGAPKMVQHSFAGL